MKVLSLIAIGTLTMAVLIFGSKPKLDHFKHSATATTPVVGIVPDENCGCLDPPLRPLAIVKSPWGSIFEFEVYDLVTELSDANGQNLDFYGKSVAVRDGSELEFSPLLVVGQPYDDGNLENSGAAFVYQSYSSQVVNGQLVPIWTLVKKLTAPTELAHANFGWDVGIHTGGVGDTTYIFVSAPSRSATGQDERSGQVFVFELSETILPPSSDVTYSATIDNPNGHAGDHFGLAIDVSGIGYPSQNAAFSLLPPIDNMMLAVGAPEANGEGTVDVFSYLYDELVPLPDWEFVREFTPNVVAPNSGSYQGAQFGQEVAVSLNNHMGGSFPTSANAEMAIIVGAPEDDYLAIPDAGSAFIFEGTANAWDPDNSTSDVITSTKLFDDVARIDANDNFGVAVDFLYTFQGGGSRIPVAAIGVHRDDLLRCDGVTWKVDIGSARIYEKSGTWPQSGLLIRPGGISSDGTGTCIQYPEIEGDHMRFGWAIQLRDQAPGNVNADYELIVGAPYDPWYELNPNPAKKRGRVYVFGKVADTIQELSQLLQDDQTPMAEQENSMYGRALAVSSDFQYLMVGAHRFKITSRQGQAYLYEQGVTLPGGN